MPENNNFHKHRSTTSTISSSSTGHSISEYRPQKSSARLEILHSINYCLQFQEPQGATALDNEEDISEMQARLEALRS